MLDADDHTGDQVRDQRYPVDDDRRNAEHGSLQRCAAGRHDGRRRIGKAIVRKPPDGDYERPSGQKRRKDGVVKTFRHGKEDLEAACPGPQAVYDVSQQGQVPVYLVLPAPRHHGDYGVSFSDAETPEELFFRKKGFDCVREWMAHVPDGDIEAPVKLLLEGQDAKDKVDPLFYLLYPAAPPRPHLGWDEIDRRDGELPGKCGYLQVEAGEIDQYEEVGLVTGEAPPDGAISPQYVGRLPEDLAYACD